MEIEKLKAKAFDVVCDITRKQQELGELNKTLLELQRMIDKLKETTEGVK